jgi:hypothetical protein
MRDRAVTAPTAKLTERQRGEICHSGDRRDMTRMEAPRVPRSKRAGEKMLAMLNGL